MVETWGRTETCLLLAHAAIDDSGQLELFFMAHWQNSWRGTTNVDASNRRKCLMSSQRCKACSAMRKSDVLPQHTSGMVHLFCLHTCDHICHFEHSCRNRERSCLVPTSFCQFISLLWSLWLTENSLSLCSFWQFLAVRVWALTLSVPFAAMSHEKIWLQLPRWRWGDGEQAFSFMSAQWALRRGRFWEHLRGAIVGVE